MPLPPQLTTRRDSRHGSKLGDIIRRLTSDSQGEALAALCAMARSLETYGCSFLDLADHIENGSGGLSDTDKKKIIADREQYGEARYADGVRATEAKYHGTGAFRNTSGALDWREVALYVQREQHRLTPRDQTDWARTFINDMASRTVDPGYEPSQKQHQHLHRFFLKLGGKIT